MIQIDRETFQMMLHQIMERFDRIDDRLNRMNRQTAALEGDKLLDNQDMCELLGVTKRTRICANSLALRNAPLHATARRSSSHTT